MTKKIFFGILAIVLLVCVGCEKEQAVSIDLTIGGESYQATLQDVTVVVKPRKMKVGEELTISVTHNEGKDESLTLSSESLGITETLTTPTIWKKQMVQAGVHDLLFKYDKDGNSSSVSTVITVVE